MDVGDHLAPSKAEKKASNKKKQQLWHRRAFAFPVRPLDPKLL